MACGSLFSCFWLLLSFHFLNLILVILSFPPYLNLRRLGVHLRQTHILTGRLRRGGSREGHERRIVTGIVCVIGGLWCVRRTRHDSHGSTGWPVLLLLLLLLPGIAWLRHETVPVQATALWTVALRTGRINGRWWVSTLHWSSIATAERLHLLLVLHVAVHGHLSASDLSRGLLFLRYACIRGNVLNVCGYSTTTTNSTTRTFARSHVAVAVVQVPLLLREFHVRFVGQRFVGAVDAVVAARLLQRAVHLAAVTV